MRELVAAIEAAPRPTLVGLSGPVSVGKTTIANELAAALRPLVAAVVSTDGFLFPNAELDARGLMMQKGFPESFDTDRLNTFLADARAGASELVFPVYDHLRYDVVGEASVGRHDVLIVEGVNALLPAHVDAYDVTVYVDAEDDAVIEWFCDRLAQLFRDAADDPASFYSAFATMSAEQVREFSERAWHGINAVNLEQHIRPARGRAGWVVEKAPDHSLRRVRAQ